MGFLKKLGRALSSKKYRSNSKSSPLTPNDFVALNIGAINAEQTSSYCDSLETGVDVQDTKNNLAGYYQIYNHESAIETLTWLRDRGHRVYFDAISGFCANKDAAINDSILTDEEKQRTVDYAANIRDTTATLTKEGFLNRIEELDQQSILGWDMGRLVLVTRCCYDASYITKEEAWEFINYAYDECKNVYDTWNDLAKGYMIGRAMAFGEGLMLGGLIRITQGLLADEQSPWKKYPLR